MPKLQSSELNRPIRLIVADDQAIVRSGLGAFLTAFEGLQLVGEAADGEEAVQLVELVQPDVVLMDVQMPRVDGITATRIIRERWPQVQILILTNYNDQEIIRHALDAGAAGYLLKDLTADDLFHAIQQVYHGEARALHTNRTQTFDPDTWKVDQELAAAGRMQSDILPSAPPDLRGWDITARLEPARETSGDFYDFIPLPNGRWGILVADVTDKGMGAALFMALSSTLIRTYAPQYPTLPAFALSAVNRRILTDTRGTNFVTVFYCVLEPDTGRLRYVNAGHNPPYLLSQQKGKRIDRLRGTGMALGVETDTVWQQKMVRLNPGDVLLLYTDGITEAQDPQGRFYGEERMLEVVREKMNCTARTIQDALLADIRRFTGDAHPHDDLALVILARKR